MEVYLRPLAASDVPTFASWGLDRLFCEHAGWTVDLPLAAHEAHWRKLLAQQELLRLAAVADSEVVGYADLAGQEPHRRELGYVIGPSTRWGQGLGGTVARLAVEHGFRRLGLQEIWAEALDANQPSIRILTSLGMTETGRGADEPFLGAPSFYRQFVLTSRTSPSGSEPGRPRSS
jgi:RimJ/RimL family protein N-acetyltransferase